MVNQDKVKTSPEDHQDKRRYASKNINENAGKGTFKEIGRKEKTPPGGCQGAQIAAKKPASPLGRLTPQPEVRPLVEKKQPKWQKTPTADPLPRSR